MIDIVSFGCRLNHLESEVARTRALEAGLTDAVVINSCSVTGEAVRDARQAVRRAFREDPRRPIVVTGCAAQIEPERFASIPEVALVLGNEEKLRAESYAMPAYGAGGARIRVGDIMEARPAARHPVAAIRRQSRAFVQVQNGCDHRCTFCVIPFGRGNSRSVPMGEVIADVRVLVEAGYREVVLTGVDLTAYGLDLPDTPPLGGLVRAILREVKELPRLRLSSIDSIEADAELIAAIAEEERLMPHFHLSLQSGDDLILKRMKRRHSRADAVRFTERVRRLRPDVAFGADLIAGFPTEDEGMFKNSLAIVDDCGLTHLHVFPFSPRPGTAAARMPQVDRALVKERASRLREAGEQALVARLEREVGTTRAVLVERGGTGLTDHFITAAIDGVPGSVVEARMIARNGRTLVAERIREAA